MDFTTTIINWYYLNKRDLPWRTTNDPYKIWLSEVILQQTRVDQGTDYYKKITKRFRNVNELANANEEELLKLWQGLGYYSRARNLHHTAKIISKEHKGKFPKTYDEIIKLKGIGPYTAAAISSFCFGEVRPVIDGNVYRVLSRFFGVEEAIDSMAGKKIVRQLAEELIDKKDPATFNQSVMEFGALQCVPKNPDCGPCALKNSCFAFANKKQNELPFKSKKTTVKNIYICYFFIRHKNNFYLKKRTENDIWKNLYEFPSVMIDKIPDKKIIRGLLKKEAVFIKQGFSLLGISKTYKHVLSHRNIFAVFVRLEVKNDFTPSKDWVKSPLGKDPVKPVPRLIDIYLREVKNE